MSSSSSRPRVLSGIQPTSDSFHLGNFLGAIRYWVDMQHDHDAFYCVVDLHAITAPHDPVALRRRTRVAAAELLAIGLDPERCTLFVQSQVPEHAQLAWVMQCLTGYGEASRMTQFKDKAARDELGSATAGLFAYPMLQAADILLYQADKVPVGEDQRQHLELTRDLAGRFNTRFGETFVVPAPHIAGETAKIADLQSPEKKMSKSAANQAGVIYLLDEPKVLEKKVKSAVTDTGRQVVAADDKPGITNLLTILSALSGESVRSCEERFTGSGYGDLKKAVAEVVIDVLTPIRERTHSWLADEAALDAVLAAGATHAREVAAQTLEQVYDRVGFLPGRLS